MHDLAIITVNINNRKILEECITAVYQNTHKISFEIIIADNGSTDGSQTMIKEKFPQVKLIENKDNLGFIKASNQGLRIADARYSILLNDDTIVKDGALDKMVAFMDTHPEAGACGAKLLNVDGTIQRQGGLLGKKFWKATQPVTVDFVIGAALLVRREVIDKVGLMDENLFFYNDDLDWCMSIRKAGWKVYFLPTAEIMHYGGYSSRKTFKPKLFIAGIIGGLYFVRKHYGEIVFQLYRCLLTLGIILALPLQVFNWTRFSAYASLLNLVARGQIPRPVLK